MKLRIAPLRRRVRSFSTHRGLDQYENWIFDCDGVLWSSSTPIKGSAEAIAQLRGANKRTVYVTNNSTKNRQTYVHKFKSMGYDVSGSFVADLNTSASFAAEHCVRNDFGRVFAIGEAGLFDELHQSGIDVLHEVGAAGLSDREFEELVLQEGVKAVVVGYDHEFSYKKLCLASLYLQVSRTYSLYYKKFNLLLLFSRRVRNWSSPTWTAQTVLVEECNLGMAATQLPFSRVWRIRNFQWL
jgi:HAD superfamily hydrolase (TIGR01450 family)